MVNKKERSEREMRIQGQPSRGARGGESLSVLTQPEAVSPGYACCCYSRKYSNMDRNNRIFDELEVEASVPDD